MLVAGSVLNSAVLMLRAVVYTLPQLSKQSSIPGMQAEGSLWRGLGVLVAGGGLRAAVLTLRKVGMPECAQALAQAVAQAQLETKQGSPDCGTPLCAKNFHDSCGVLHVDSDTLCITCAWAVAKSMP